MIPEKYRNDVDRILSKKHDNGADFWTTPDGRWGVGSPFSAFDRAFILTELGMKKSDPVMNGIARQIFNTWRDDGRFKAAPKGTMYPCYTANAARTLCHLGYARDKRLKRTFEYLLDVQDDHDGWRCNTVRMGKSAATDASNPGTILAALDAFRFTQTMNLDKRLNKAVEFLLDHWTTRKPLGPCHFGVGSLFIQVEYPMFRYNLFFYVYVLSFYKVAINDPRFREAFSVLAAKEVGGKLVVENPNRKMANFCFAKKGSQVSAHRGVFVKSEKIRTQFRHPDQDHAHAAHESHRAAVRPPRIQGREPL